MKTTLGVFITHSAAESALNELKGFGVAESDLSYIYENREGELKDAQSGDKVGSGAATGAATGLVIGGIAGLVVANVILPGFGTLFVAGPLAAALGVTGATATAVAGAATGAAAGGLIGALTNFGVEESDVKLYEEHVRQGDVLVIARGTPTSTKDIFMNQGAVQVREYTTI
jgi:uncharacterized membrane protein